MQGDPIVIAHLNAQLKNELNAINQYFLHARMYRHWGLPKIGKKEYDDSIEVMIHADQLINRILMLDGLSYLKAFHKMVIGEHALEMLQADLKLETTSQKEIKEGIEACEKASDFVSRDILQKILDYTEEHIEWIETQIDLINKIGIQKYLQSQMEGTS